MYLGVFFPSPQPTAKLPPNTTISTEKIYYKIKNVSVKTI
jgi:hypothetical protein